MNISAGQKVTIDAKCRKGEHVVHSVLKSQKKVHNIALVDPDNPKRFFHIAPESVVGFSKVVEKRKGGLNGGSKIILGIATRIAREEHMRRLTALSEHSGDVREAAASIGMEYQTLFGYAQRFAAGGAKSALAALKKETAL